VNLEGATISCWLWLPQGSAGASNARNGVQLFCKSEDAHGNWWSWYSQWTNIQPAWEEHWVEFTANLATPPGHRDAQWDPTNVVAVGVKAAINDRSTATLTGHIYLDDYMINTEPPLVFDFERLEVEQDFIHLQRVFRNCATTKVVRVFVFADGRAAPDFTPEGAVAGFDEHFFQDFDVVLTVAKRRGFLLLPVLLDFLWCKQAEVVNGVQLGGHADVIRDPAKRRTFFRHALEPLVRRYSDHPHIYAWEVVSEPEWAMRGVPEFSDIDADSQVTVPEMQDFVARCTRLIHRYTSHQVTVGSARLQWMLDYWQGLGLDLYQFHSYDHLPDPFPWPRYEELGLDKPCIIGEVPTANTQHSIRRYLRVAQEQGYHGVLAWSLRASDAFSDFSRAQRQLETWCARGG
jgi:hypothetical protein